MEQSNGGTPTKKKQVFFSIGSYSERDKRVINKISPGLFSDVTLRNEQPAREPPPRRVLRERPASLDATDSVKHSHTLPNLRKFKPLESLVDEDDRVVIVDKNGDVEKPSCPPTSSGDNACAKPTAQQPNGQVEKPTYPPKMMNRSVSLDTDQLRHTGKVALTIAAYEGESRTPTRLDFLPSQKLSRSSSKASDVTSSLTTTPLEEEAAEHIGSRLQNELVATLKRSNLKKRHDEDGETPPPPPPPPPPQSPAALQDNGRVEEVEVHVEQSKDEAELPSGGVKKVATVLEKSLTFRANPEATTAPTDLPEEIVEKKEHEVENVTQKEELDLKEVAEAPAEKDVLQVQAHEAPEKEVHEVEAHEAPEKEALKVEAHEAPEKEVHEVEAHEAPEKQVVEAEAHESSSAAELPKEEKKEEHKGSEKEHEPVLQVEEAKVEDKVPEKDVKLPEKSIEQSLVDAFDEIITLTDDTEKKK
ncbi:SH3 domain-containing protein 21 isoform X2 [Nasonia vitripennis]|uniref:Uncharacterized protein n=1 Tax=Nasonia vitripennis TaxID=7425 RepID=A0A7M7Q1L3_NASVI|nr:SH3 domain-containing protein 21 isoform X2 [Nasonia vitripennis]XP_032457412.1 SH3 domain-containing protein 21 isoform X2 [Nasonia vitripennis]XP_032457417.1 SH3 domain-containing protein 21 isoform X2 [Nasonia vitripennis]XP_032457418.1 SH3 domain-containing protein 21 isoform X2 [Nasonia vitripennis]